MKIFVQEALKNLLPQNIINIYACTISINNFCFNLLFAEAFAARTIVLIVKGINFAPTKSMKITEDMSFPNEKAFKLNKELKLDDYGSLAISGFSSEQYSLIE